MATRDLFGWELDPVDSKDVVGGRTKLGQLRLWIIPKDQVRAVCDSELGKGLLHPGLYVLFNNEVGTAYVGQSADLKGRLSQHLDRPPKELGNFDQVLLLNDGRSSVHSLFNDTTLRESLEQATIDLFKTGGEHKLVNRQLSPPQLSSTQQTLHDRLRQELGHVLYQLDVISERPAPDVDRSIVDLQDVSSRFKGKTITGISGYEGQLAGEKVYFRKGSEKPQGLQVTIRVGEPFGKAVNQGKGYLCINRGRCYLIPTDHVRKWLGKKFEQQTVDIFLDLAEETLKTAGIDPLPVSQFGGAKSSKE